MLSLQGFLWSPNGKTCLHSECRAVPNASGWCTVSQQLQHFDQPMPALHMYYVPPIQLIQPQQQQQSAQTQNSAIIQANNINKPKLKRICKITIRDPRYNKDVTEEILRSSTGINSNWASQVESFLTNLTFSGIITNAIYFN